MHSWEKCMPMCTTDFGEKGQDTEEGVWIEVNFSRTGECLHCLGLQAPSVLDLFTLFEVCELIWGCGICLSHCIWPILRLADGDISVRFPHNLPSPLILYYIQLFFWFQLVGLFCWFLGSHGGDYWEFFFVAANPKVV